MINNNENEAENDHGKFMKKLSNAEAELEKSDACKKKSVYKVTLFTKNRSNLDHLTV